MLLSYLSPVTVLDRLDWICARRSAFVRDSVVLLCLISQSCMVCEGLCFATSRICLCEKKDSFRRESDQSSTLALAFIRFSSQFPLVLTKARTSPCSVDHLDKLSIVIRMKSMAWRVGSISHCFHLELSI